ncbi:MAG: hypothetical protein P8P36_08565 [Akkermansiaceae bacterium]|nr:hypothetical protein [Akkermansiaceae bacterium]
MKKIISVSQLLTAVLLIGPALGDTLETHNGNIITGKIQSFDREIITIQSPLSDQPISLKASSLKNLVTTLPNNPSPNHSEILTLSNGDQLACKILSSDTNNINITTWYAGDMAIARPNVASIRFGIIAENMIFTGNEPPEKWNHMSGQWTMTDRHHYRGTGHLAQSISLPEKARFHYDLQWQDSPNFAFRFFAETHSANSKQNTYELIFNSEGMEIRRHLKDKDGPSRIASLNTPQIESIQKKKKALNIDLRIDKNEGLISLYLDSNFMGTWHDPLGSTKGDYVIFNNRNQQAENCTIGNIVISSLSGDVTPRFYDANATSTETDILTDNEGECIPGEFLSIETGDAGQRVVCMKRSESQSVDQIPEHRVSNLSFKKNEMEKPQAKQHYTLTLKSDGKLHVNQAEISSSEVSVIHPILGPLHLSRNALKSISRSADSSPDTELPKYAQVTLLNGDKLSGNFQSTQDQQISISAPYFNEPAIFQTSQILSIQMDKKDPVQEAKTFTRVQFHHRNREANGDTIIGDLHELNKDNIKINTRYGKTLTLKRSMIQSLDIISGQQGQYYGPNSRQEWETSATKPMEKAASWRYSNGSLLCNGDAVGSIGKEVNLRDKSHVSFDILWEKYLGLTLQLYSSDPKSSSSSSCYQFEFDKFAITMMTQTKGRADGHRRQRFAANVKPKLGKSHFDIYINRETGTANIHLDDQHVGILQSPHPDAQNLGTALSFVSKSARPAAISNISISPWHGLKPGNLEANGKGSETKDKSPHNIVLINGDQIPCKVGIIENALMRLNTEHTPINIPIEKIKSINWEDKREEPKKYREDVRAWFHTGGFITLKLASIKDDKLSGYSQTTGDTTLDTEAFARIDFNIYNAEADELRAEYISQ